jgi:hypothetical protein
MQHQHQSYSETSSTNKCLSDHSSTLFSKAAFMAAPKLQRVDDDSLKKYIMDENDVEASNKETLDDEDGPESSLPDPVSMRINNGIKAAPPNAAASSSVIAVADDPKNEQRNTTTNQKHPPSPTWWKRYVARLARVWTPRSVESWCMIEPDPPTPFLLYSKQVAEGMIYIKTYKASSSTCEGIAWSIAHHVGRRRQEQKAVSAGQPEKASDAAAAADAVCRAYTRHEFADNRMHARRDPAKSLLWTFVRNPAARDLSHIYHFEIGRKNRTSMTSMDIQKQIQAHIKGRQTRYLVRAKTSRAPLWPLHELKRNRTDLVMYMKDEIFVNYDFIGLTERMTESLAVIVLLWEDLQPQDVIVLNSKRSGGFDDGGNNQTCTAIPKADMTPELQEYFEYRHQLWNADVLLYHAANASLQMTIDSLGRERVQQMAQIIEALQQTAQERCLDEANFPCSPEGVYQPELAETSCYVQDAGCGHDCVDRVLSSSSTS